MLRCLFKASGEYLKSLARHGKIVLTPKIRSQPAEISHSTLARMNLYLGRRAARIDFWLREYWVGLC